MIMMMMIIIIIIIIILLTLVSCKCYVMLHTTDCLQPISSLFLQLYMKPFLK